MRRPSSLWNLDSAPPGMIVGLGLQQLGDQSGPAGLVRGAEAAPGVAVEIFVEQQVVAEMRVGLQLVVWPNTARRPCASRRNSSRQPAGQFFGDLQDRHDTGRSRWGIRP